MSGGTLNRNKPPANNPDEVGTWIQKRWWYMAPGSKYLEALQRIKDLERQLKREEQVLTEVSTDRAYHRAKYRSAAYDIDELNKTVERWILTARYWKTRWAWSEKRSRLQVKALRDLGVLCPANGPRRKPEAWEKNFVPLPIPPLDGRAYE